MVKRLQFFEFFGKNSRLRSKQLLPMEFAFIEKEQFEAMAYEAGFQVVALHGDYECSPSDAVQSLIMIWVLEKRI